MKRLWTLAVVMLCALLATAQFAHAYSAENIGCDMRIEQHVKTKDASEKVSVSKQVDKKADKENCCESCHLQMVAIPTIAVQKAAPKGDVVASIPASPYGIFSDMLSEPPQA